jgi:hypothetical protein
VPELEVALADDNSSAALLLSNGTYPLSATIDIQRNVTLRAETPGQAVLDGQGTVTVLHVLVPVVVVIHGLVIANGWVGNATVGNGLDALVSAGGILVKGGATLVVTGQSVVRNNNGVPPLSATHLSNRANVPRAGGISVSDAATTLMITGGSILHDNTGIVRTRNTPALAAPPSLTCPARPSLVVPRRRAVEVSPPCSVQRS